MSFYNILLFFLLIFNFQTQQYYIDSLIDNKQYMLAEKAIINSIKENPNNEILIKKLGDCYGFIKDWDNAIIQYQKLIELDSENSVYNYKLGGTLAAKANETNRFKSLSLINKSKKYLLKSVKLDNKNKPAMWVLIQIFTELPQLLGGDKSVALQYASELENISLVDGLFAKKYIYDFKDDHKMSNIYLNKIIENLDFFSLEYDYNYLNFRIGELCAINKINLDRGIMQLNYYIENFTSRDRSTPDHAYYLLAKIYLHKNDFSNAKKQLDNAFVYYNSNNISNHSFYRELLKFKKLISQ